MEILPQLQLRTAETQPVAGHGVSGVGVSTLVHATWVLLSVGAMVAPQQPQPLRSGTTQSTPVLTLSATTSQPPQEAITVQQLGIEDAVPEVPVPEVPVPEVPVPEVATVDAPERFAPPTIEAMLAQSATDLEVPTPKLEPRKPPRGRPDGQLESPPETDVTPPLTSKTTSEAAASDSSGAPPDAAPQSPAGAAVTERAEPQQSNPPPVYPAAAIRQRREGRVVLRVKVSARGEPLDVAIHRTSGYDDFDAAALAAVRQWEFRPAKSEAETVPQTIAVPVRFSFATDRDG